MTDAEIKKALECCILGDCQGCFYGDTDQRHCKDDLMQNALDLINRQEEEIERVKDMVAQNEGVLPRYENLIKAEAYKEFAEKVHCICLKTINNPWMATVYPASWIDAYEQFDKEVDDLLEEMVGENDAR